MLVSFPISGAYEKSDPVEASPSDLLNLYETKVGEDRLALFSTPGLNLDNGARFIADGGVRNMYVSRLTPNMHVVVGEYIKQIDSAFNVVNSASLTTNEGYVGIDDTNNEIMFVDGSEGVIFNKTTNIYTKITSPSFPDLPADVVVFGGRFYVIKGGTDEIYFSDINDGTVWNTLNKFKITTTADEAVSLAVMGGRLYVFGKQVTEVWVLQGGSFPVARDESIVLEYGCVSAGVVKSEGGLMCWVGYDKEGITSVVTSEGSMPTRISTHVIERELQSYGVVNDARAFMYIEKGNLFYQLNFTVANKSWLYNFNTTSWSRLAYKDDDRHRAECYAFFNSKKYVGDFKRPYIYSFSNDNYVDSEVAIKRLWVSQILLPNKTKPFICRMIRLIVEQGVGTESGDNERPRLMLRISRDGGITFGNQLARYIGNLGRTQKHTEFYQLGLFEYGSIVLEVSFYNRTRFAIIGCAMEIDA
jgi:hypothetical protein